MSQIIIGSGNGGFMLLYIIVLAALLYFLMIRPQKKHQDKHKQMLNALKVDDRILTVGGITGYVRDLNDTYIYVEIADGLVIELNRQYVATVLQEDDVEDAEDELPEEDVEEIETVEQIEEVEETRTETVENTDREKVEEKN
ncbi:MAG: preprotein translocase subunit YajC [Peptococcaceae bacterium]|nr:preprotein translocase subunit YajC [Peptococcaceae bacterium]